MPAWNSKPGVYLPNMKALRFEEHTLRLVPDQETPQRCGEALVRVSMAGICNTDVEIVRGYANFSGTLGHEFVGVVVESPDPAQIGMRTVGEINAGCGTCPLCRSGDPRHCGTRTVLGIHNRDGAFAEYLILPSHNLLPVPDALTDREAVFAEPLAAACEILDQIDIGPNHRVAILGDGKLGQLIARVLKAFSGAPLLIGKHPGKLHLASQAGIATQDLATLRIDPSTRFDTVVEASGSPAGLDLALDLVRPRGAIVLKSTFHGPVQLDTSRVVVDEIQVIGSRCGRFAPALRMLAEHKVDVRDLITAEFSLDDGMQALQAAQAPEALKILLNCRL